MPNRNDPAEAGIKQINVVGTRVPEVVEVLGDISCLKRIYFFKPSPIEEEFWLGSNAERWEQRP
jgi:hypothetical protein